jgi:hypothetical protein
MNEMIGKAEQLSAKRFGVNVVHMYDIDSESTRTIDRKK